MNYPHLPISLIFWVELVGACNSIWYQSQRSRVRILVSAIKYNNCCSLLFHIWGLREPPREGECWNISELPTSPHQLKLLGWTGRCMQLNSAFVLFCFILGLFCLVFWVAPSSVTQIDVFRYFIIQLRAALLQVWGIKSFLKASFSTDDAGT